MRFEEVGRPAPTPRRGARMVKRHGRGRDSARVRPRGIPASAGGGARGQRRARAGDRDVRPRHRRHPRRPARAVPRDAALWRLARRAVRIHAEHPARSSTNAMRRRCATAPWRPSVRPASSCSAAARPEALQRDAAAFLAAGPPPLGDAELARRRYVLTDAVDDLMGARDGDERAVVAAQVLVAVAELALIVDGCWLGAGKWLLRKLRAARAPRPPAGCSTRTAGRSATVTRRRSARWPRRCWPTPAGASARATDRPRHVAEPVHRASRAARR
jgi:hypothetical protein